MKPTLLLAISAALVLSAGAASAKPSPAILAAVADAGRPEADKARDANRKPAEMLEFAGVKPGAKVADFIPGGGYFTRIFAKAVGPKGKVYAVINRPAVNAPPPNPPVVKAIAADPAYANVQVVETDVTAISLPEPVDVIWTSQNYHDLYRRGVEGAQRATRAIYDSLKPGGVFIVLDHAAAPGTPVDPQDRLHRIDPEIVKKDVQAAGFKFEGESVLLRNPADDHSKGVFDPAVRGKTDQFIYKFRKPK